MGDPDGQDEVLGSTGQPWWVAVAVGVLVVAVVATLIVRLVATQRDPQSHPVAIGSVSATQTSARNLEPSPAPRTSAVPTRPTTTSFSTALLGVRSGWELFGRGDGVLVRIDPSRGRLTTTGVPALSSSGPVSFVVGTSSALIRPIDDVPGYVVPDGRPARRLTGVFGSGGPEFPGPLPAEIWVPAGDSAPHKMVLVDDSGRRVGPSLSIPVGSSLVSAVSDQAGHLAFPDLDEGAYEARPGHVTRISTGPILAVGPTRWLISECASRTRCVAVVIARPGGQRHELTTVAVPSDGPIGAISPVGTTAALIAGSASPALELLDLTTGAARTLPLAVDPSAPGGPLMVWSPDGRYLFVIAASGHLYAVDAQTDGATDLTAATHGAVPDLTQLAIRQPA